MVSLKQYLDILDTRPYKFNAEQVGYGPAPEGSVMRCCGCIHYFRRAIDGFAVCEIFRDPETDENGVRPDFRCAFWTVDAEVHPLMEEPEEEPPLPEEETIPY